MRVVWRGEERNSGILWSVSQAAPWQQSLIPLGKDFPNCDMRLALMNYIPFRPLITNNTKLKLQKIRTIYTFKNSFPLILLSFTFILVEVFLSFQAGSCFLKPHDSLHQHFCCHCYHVLSSLFICSRRFQVALWNGQGTVGVMSSHFGIASAD